MAWLASSMWERPQPRRHETHSLASHKRCNAVVRACFCSDLLRRQSRVRPAACVGQGACPGSMRLFYAGAQQRWVARSGCSAIPGAVIYARTGAIRCRGASPFIRCSRRSRAPPVFRRARPHHDLGAYHSLRLSARNRGCLNWAEPPVRVGRLACSSQSTMRIQAARIWKASLFNLGARRA
jgi:hypothetical protein